MHINYFTCKTVTTFKTILFAPTCFGLHQPLSLVMVYVNRANITVLNVLTVLQLKSFMCII